LFNAIHKESLRIEESGVVGVNEDGAQ
jgi:hypothetical protein